MRHHTGSNSINGAKLLTARVANLKDYQVRNKRLRAFRELARELMAGKGYIIASANEMNDRFGQFIDEPITMAEGNDKKYVWALHKFITRKTVIGFLAV